MSARPRPSGDSRPTPPATGATNKAGRSRPAPTQLTPDEVVALCWNMTTNKRKATTAAAVILAESGGNTHARCYNRKNAAGTVYCGAPGPGPGGRGGGVLSIDRGLCQFNSVWHPEVSDADADNPRKAVSAMFHVSQGFVDFNAWSTYKPPSGTPAYLRYLPITTSAWDAIDAKGPGAWRQLLDKIGSGFVAGGEVAGRVAGGVAAATMSLGEFLAHISDPAVWHRVVYVVLGLALILGAAFLAGDSLLHQVAGSVVTGVAGKLAG